MYDLVSLTIEQELVEEIDFLANYNRTKRAIQQVVDMPDRLVDLFTQFCLQNKGRLGARMENAVREKSITSSRPLRPY